MVHLTFTHLDISLDSPYITTTTLGPQVKDLPAYSSREKAKDGISGHWAVEMCMESR